ncbi:RpiB/LacA/LacB family sugar-phosphate isomerase [Clostridium grantii]|uniref:Ribose 5-phosphate isomerase B n=1 Tax=Clostridium grantii DSM 8605 TaxID=1121316 RepID=A0A1M5UJ74_9CLOT|nr:RpiB/LacA/LacB family sugar-phosphate isomerase [Clostridium grantii]SHH63019.1 ribose 5-phosphate isomerase B [Clostridium grantii DSM 8605]
MKIIIGSDKSGFTLKEAVKAYLLELGHEVTDAGTQNIDSPKPFFDVAPVVASAIQNKEYERGILVCGTGAGMAIVANKYHGVYAVAVESVYSAKKCRAINNANIMSMGGWIVAPELGIEMVDAFVNTEFTQDLEPWRQDFLKNAYNKVGELEKEKNLRGGKDGLDVFTTR